MTACATIRRRADAPPVPAAIVLPPRTAEQAAERARERGLSYTAALFDAAATAWSAALCTLGEERDRLNEAGAAAWCAASARSMEAEA